MFPLVETSGNPALKATDSSTGASHDASDKQHKKASLWNLLPLLRFSCFLCHHSSVYIQLQVAVWLLFTSKTKQFNKNILKKCQYEFILVKYKYMC